MCKVPLDWNITVDHSNFDFCLSTKKQTDPIEWEVFCMSIQSLAAQLTCLKFSKKPWNTKTWLRTNIFLVSLRYEPFIALIKLLKHIDMLTYWDRKNPQKRVSNCPFCVRRLGQYREALDLAQRAKAGAEGVDFGLRKHLAWLLFAWKFEDDFSCFVNDAFMMRWSDNMVWLLYT